MYLSRKSNIMAGGGTLLGFIDYIDPESEKKKGCMRGAPTHTKPTPGGKLGLGVLKGRVGVGNFP